MLDWRHYGDAETAQGGTPQGYRIYVEYDDGERGEVDLSHNVGKGVFKVWDEPGVFEQVHIVDGYAIGWSDELELCPDAVYFQLTGKTPEEMMPGLRADVTQATEVPNDPVR